MQQFQDKDDEAQGEPQDEVYSFDFLLLLFQLFHLTLFHLTVHILKCRYKCYRGIARRVLGHTSRQADCSWCPLGYSFNLPR